MKYIFKTIHVLISVVWTVFVEGGLWLIYVILGFLWDFKFHGIWGCLHTRRIERYDVVAYVNDENIIETLNLRMKRIL